MAVAAVVYPGWSSWIDTGPWRYTDPSSPNTDTCLDRIVGVQNGTDGPTTAESTSRVLDEEIGGGDGVSNVRNVP